LRTTLRVFYEHHVRQQFSVRASRKRQIEYLVDTVACLRRQHLQSFRDHLRVRVYEILPTPSKGSEPLPSPAEFFQAAHGLPAGLLQCPQRGPQLRKGDKLRDSIAYRCEPPLIGLR
jgi:hypothetical protein